MKRKFVFILSVFVLLSTMVYVRFNTVEVKATDGIDPSKIYGVEMLWNNSMSVYDVAVSRDGNYIAVVNDTGLYYFAWDNSTPKWWYLWQNIFRSVAISANGEYVVAGDNSGHLCYFNDSKTTTNERPSPTWESTSLYGQIQRGTLDMSDDGEYVVVVGTGSSLYYFANCTARSSFGENPTWQKMFGVADFLAVDLSPDGRYVAAGGSAYGPNGFVVFYKDANIMPYPTEEAWFSSSSINSSIIDLALSDDGYAVVATDLVTLETLYYWANATTLTGDPNATWKNEWAYSCVDMSADGDSVVAGGNSPQIVHFWSNAREQEGTQEANWVRYQAPYNADDVAISDGSGIIAATTHTTTPDYKAYFFKSDGSMIGEFDLLQYSPLVSMSGNGSITAIGGLGFDSLYVFRMIVDTTPPLIENVHQQPTNETVYPEDDVMVYANVTDDPSGVKQVILNYTYTNSTGTWNGAVIMDNLEGNLYNGTIPRLPYCTNVTYVIIAEDNFNNTITTEEMGYIYKYHVIPEFPSYIILPLFAIATLLTAIISKRKLFRRTKT